MKSSRYSEVSAKSRTYRFQVTTNRAGRRYLVITELSSDGSSTSTYRIAIFQPHMTAFHEAYLKAAKQLEPKLRAYDVAEIRKESPNAFKKWTPGEDEQLVAKFHAGLQVLDLAKLFGRQPGGITARLKTLGLIDTIRRPPAVDRQRLPQALTSEALLSEAPQVRPNLSGPPGPPSPDDQRLTGVVSVH